MAQRTSEQRLEIALRAVRTASRLCREIAAAMASGPREDFVIRKEDNSPVTAADLAAQVVINRTLAAALGVEAMVAEESSATLREERNARVLARVASFLPGLTHADIFAALDWGAGTPAGTFTGWTLDPIDGTKGFIRSRQYAVCLAYIESGEPVVGVIGCPNLSIDRGRPLDDPDPSGSVYAATAAGPTLEFDGLDERPGVIVRCGEWDGGPFPLAESFEPEHVDRSAVAAILRDVGPYREVRVDSQCKYALVARGQARAYMLLRTKTDGYHIWDHAAGVLLTRRGGCVASDVRGRALDFSRPPDINGNEGIVAAPPRLHAAIIAAAGRA